MATLKTNMKKLRLWLADKLIGDQPYMSNVKFYQTACLDVGSGVHINRCSVNLNHGIEWKGKKESFGICFDRYEEHIGEQSKRELVEW